MKFSLSDLFIFLITISLGIAVNPNNLSDKNAVTNPNPSVSTVYQLDTLADQKIDARFKVIEEGPTQNLSGRQNFGSRSNLTDYSADDADSSDGFSEQLIINNEKDIALPELTEPGLSSDSHSSENTKSQEETKIVEPTNNITLIKKNDTLDETSKAKFISSAQVISATGPEFEKVPLNETEPVDKTVPVIEIEQISESEIVSTPKPVKEAEMLSKPNLVSETESIRETEPISQPKPKNQSVSNSDFDSASEKKYPPIKSGDSESKDEYILVDDKLPLSHLILLKGSIPFSQKQNCSDSLDSYPPSEAFEGPPFNKTEDVAELSDIDDLFEDLNLTAIYDKIFTTTTLAPRTKIEFKTGSDAFYNLHNDPIGPQNSLIIYNITVFKNKKYLEPFLAVVMMFFIHNILGFLTKKVESSRDRFIHHFLETAYRTFTELLILFSLLNILQYYQWISVSTEFYWSFISFLFAYTQCIILFSTISWVAYRSLKKCDTKPIDYFLSPKASFLEKSFCVFRYEFTDAVAMRSVKNLDPKFYNFMEYIRSCYLKIITGFLRPSKVVLILTMILLYSIDKIPIQATPYIQLPILILINISLCLIFLKAKFIVLKLMPSDTEKYIQLQSQEDCKDYQAIENVGPVYKKLKGKKVHGKLSKMLKGTKYPTQHSSLFLFWKNGASLLIKMLEVTIIAGQLAFSQTGFVTSENSLDNITAYSSAVLSLFFLLMLPLTTWYCTLAVCTGEKIQESVLVEVWELERSKTVSRIVFLLDTLRIEAMLYELAKPGSIYKSELRNQVASMSPELSKQVQSLWNSLDVDDDQCLNVCQLYSFLRSQGLSLLSESSVYEWFNIFDRNHDDRITFEEFKFILLVTRQLNAKPMDTHSVIELLNQKYNFPLDAVDIINVSSLKRLFKELRLHKQWGGTEISRLLHLVCIDSKSNGISLERFVYGLKRFEVGTIAPLTQAVDEIKNLYSDTSESLNNHRSIKF